MTTWTKANEFLNILNCKSYFSDIEAQLNENCSGPNQLKVASAANADSPLQKLRAALKSCLFGQGRLVYLTGLELDWSWSVGPQWEPLPFPLTSALVLVLGGRRAFHTAATATLGLSIFISAHKFTHLLSLEVKVGEAVVHPDRQLHTSPRRRNAGK